MLFIEKEIRSELTKFIRINTLHGTVLYLIDMSMYLACILGVLYLPELWMKAIASIGAGIKISNLATIAHDAGHNSLTRSRKLNDFIAVIALLPGLMNYRLWAYNHQLHHSLTNKKFPESIFPDNFTPYSKEEFDALTPFSQKKEKFYRMPSLIGFGIYFIYERWLNVMLFPRNHMSKEVHEKAWKNFTLVAIYFSCLMILLSSASIFTETTSFVAIFLGLFMPILIFQCLMGFTVYVQHTHERVAWFKDSTNDEKNGNNKHEVSSIQLTFSKWLAPLMEMHHAYDHGAHHICPAIPCYRVKKAQERLNELLGEKTVSQRFSLSWLFKTMNKCKLYDYENHCWLNFDGKPTTSPIHSDKQIEFSNAA